MEGVLLNIARLFSESDPKISSKALKKITENLENAINITFPNDLTKYLLSKFSQSINKIDDPNHRLICKEFLYFFKVYLNNCTFNTFKDYFIALVSQGLKISDHIKSKPTIQIDITLLIDYFESIFNVFKGKITFENPINDDISLEESLIGATIHSILQVIEDGNKNPNCFSILNLISESIDTKIAINYYPGICSRLGKFIIKSTNDISRAHALDSLGLWILKVMDSSIYNITLDRKIKALHTSTEYSLEFDIITKDRPELIEVITNTNHILQSITNIRPGHMKLINTFIEFFEKILKKCILFISKQLHSDIIAFLLINCKINNNASKILQSNNLNMITSRDVVGRSMASGDFTASIDLFQGYHRLNGVIPLDRFVVFTWLLKISEQQFIDSASESTSIDKFFKYGNVSGIITNYYKNQLEESQKYEILESLAESLHGSIGELDSPNTSKWLLNLNTFTNELNVEFEYSILIPLIVNVGFLIDTLNMIPFLDVFIKSFRVILRCTSEKQYLDNQDKLLLCNVYHTLNKFTKYKLELINCGIHSLIFDTIHLTYSANISSYTLEFMNSLYGDIPIMLSKYSNHLINTCASIIRSYDINNNNNIRLSMVKNVIGFIGKCGLEEANTGLSHFALDVLNIPIHLNCIDTLVKPIIVDTTIIEYDEEYVITLLNSVLISFQKEIARFRNSKMAICDIKDINDCICDDDITSIKDILQPIMPIDSLGKFGLYRRVATAVVARTRHAMLRYNLACKASISVLLSLYILSTDTSELLPRISEIFPMALKNINASVVLSSYAIVILKYCNLLTPDFVKHKQSDIVNQIYERLSSLELANDADERHLSSRFIFQSFALEYLVIITESRQFCQQVIFKIALFFSRIGISCKLSELTRKLWMNLKETYPNHVMLLIKCIRDGLSDDMMLRQILGEHRTSPDLDLGLIELESQDFRLSLKIPSRFRLKQIPLSDS